MYPMEYYVTLKRNDNLYFSIEYMGRVDIELNKSDTRKQIPHTLLCVCLKNAYECITVVVEAGKN